MVRTSTPIRSISCRTWGNWLITPIDPVIVVVWATMRSEAMAT